MDPPPPGAPAAAGDLVVRWCPEVDAPHELFAVLGYLDTHRVGRVELPGPCEAPSPTEQGCVYRDLREGRYPAAQGPFAAQTRTVPDAPTELDLGCIAACGADVEVWPRDDCASAGEFILASGWEEAGRQQLARVDWRAGLPFTLRDLPCLPDTAVDIRADGCEPLQDHLPLEEVRAQWSFDLRPEGDLMIQVVDAATEDPISGATLHTVGRPELEPSDTQGWIGPYAQEPGDYLPFLHKAGYAQRHVTLHNFDDDGVFVAYLHPLRAVEVRCDDSGAPCPEGTSVMLDRTNPEARFGRCARQDVWTWSCEVLEGDRVYARTGRRESEALALRMDGRDTVWLPPPRRRAVPGLGRGVRTGLHAVLRRSAGRWRVPLRQLRLRPSEQERATPGAIACGGQRAGHPRLPGGRLVRRDHRRGHRQRGL